MSVWYIHFFFFLYEGIHLFLLFTNFQFYFHTVVPDYEANNVWFTPVERVKGSECIEAK